MLRAMASTTKISGECVYPEPVSSVQVCLHGVVAAIDMCVRGYWCDQLGAIHLVRV